MDFKIKLLTHHATVPTKATSHSAGYDLYSAKDYVVNPRDKVLIDTDIAISLPVGTYGRIAPRSSLSSKYFTDIGAGVIDNDYRGPIKVLLFNHSKDQLHIKIGDKIAQLIIEKYYNIEYTLVDELNETERNKNGFGSSGGATLNTQPI